MTERCDSHRPGKRVRSVSADGAASLPRDRVRAPVTQADVSRSAPPFCLRTALVAAALRLAAPPAPLVAPRAAETRHR